MNAPHHQQELDYSCLPACVRMVLAFYGSHHTERKLRQLFKTRHGGTSPANVLLHLPTLGFTANFPEASLSYLKAQIQTERPCIVHVWTPPLPHWNTEAIHALVISDITQEQIHAHDPILESGPTTITLSAFLHAWAATANLTLIITPISK